MGSDRQGPLEGFRKRTGRKLTRGIKRVFHSIGLGVVRSERLARLLRTEQSFSRFPQLFSSLGALPPGEREAAYAFASYCVAHHESSRGQLFQDLFVLAALNRKRGGYFVEFGATDGMALSNTYLLETEYGWNGILAEPGRVWHDALRANRRCVIDTRCIWSRSGEQVLFNESEVAELSTVDAVSPDDGHEEARRVGRRYLVETLSLNDLLAQHGAPRAIDYLSVDTEGSELEILRAFDFAGYDVKVITVEHNHTPQREALHALLTSKGFTRMFPWMSDFDDWYVKPGIALSHATPDHGG